jgi:hypothetical protein
VLAVKVHGTNRSGDTYTAGPRMTRIFTRNGHYVNAIHPL